MDTEREDIELGKLFRDKLGNAEIVPDPSVSVRLMRRLARREFMTFKASSFNVYYLGLLVAAGIAAAILLSPSKRSPEVLPDQILNEVQLSVSEKSEVVAGITDYLNTRPESGTTKSVSDKSEAGKDHAILPVLIQSEAANRPPSIDHNKLSAPRVANDIQIREPDSDKLVISSKAAVSLFVSSVTDGCVPLKVRFVCTAQYGDAYRWTFGDGGVSVEKAPQWIFDVDGEYKVLLEIYSKDKLVGSSYEIIKVYPRPVANFEISPEKAVIPDDEIRFINYSAEAVKYLWDFGDGTRSELFEPHHKYTQFDNYNVKLTVHNGHGCADSVIVQNAFAGSEYYIEFPNAFIPNTEGPTGGIYSSKSDEMAQVFHPSSFGVSEYQLKIFSKIGILLFESNDINIGWDGYFKGQLSNSGVYIWKVRGKYRNGEPFTKMGDITLLKNH